MNLLPNPPGEPARDSKGDCVRVNSLGVGSWVLGVLVAGAIVASLMAQAPQTPAPAVPPPPQQPSEIQLVISGEPGRAAYAVLTLALYLTPQRRKALGQGWTFNFEREFYMIRANIRDDSAARTPRVPLRVGGWAKR